METKKVVVDDFLSDEEDDSQSASFVTKIARKRFDEARNKFDIKKIYSEFIVKKEYFVTHQKNNILEDYDFDDAPLGQGAFGTVYRVIQKKTGLIRAAKKILISNLTNKDTFLKEVSALKVLDHPNIIKLYEVYEDSSNRWVYLIEEYWEGGELFDYIIDNDGLPEYEAARIFHQIVSSIIYCHKNCISHRDLKPDNFMLTTWLPGTPIKLIDFGLSRQFFKFHETGGEIFRMETRAGTKLYMAPEVLCRNYSNSCDMWSLGVILYIMVSSQVPFEGETDTQIEDSIINIRYNFNNEVWDTVSDEWKDLISKILVHEKYRITPKDTLNHPWVKKTLLDDAEQRNKTIYMERFEGFKESSLLKKAILSFLASKVNDNDIKEEIALFKRFDSNNDGYISK